MNDDIQRAARAIAGADAILIGAGAGMGVDSGLPDFRGKAGFWQAYPVFENLGIAFHEVATPALFHVEPHLAWGFYGHRLNLYRRTVPHRGFQILQDFCRDKPHFVFTSNVDGHFQKSGVSSQAIEEYHGSIHHLQCADLRDCPAPPAIWSADETSITVDEETLRAQEPLPSCPRCRQVARPNILMFGDTGWISDRSDAQRKRFAQWQNSIRGKSVVIEIGAGTAIPSVRRPCETFAQQNDATLIRLNPREADGPSGTISLRSNALAALKLIQAER